ncbi:MAG: asparagine synthase C-terminal domain-containing protein [Candidatus Burarchaeum sp.]|nr:asparagine synthase C-terminal domain-containing protein [Candidatus Burarchaeum sp.]MDO8339785.1 asparagine synthase C-terminal domain-containing protein [Candidatus Burarchaeum sp.]
MDEDLLVELKESVERAVENACRGERVGVLFSGGLDSSLIAFLAKRHALGVELFTAGMPDSPDVSWAVRVAAELALPLNISVLNEGKVLALYGAVEQISPGDLLKVELGVPLLACCREAKRLKVRILLSGSGAEELFGGYQRHWEAFEKGQDVGAMLREELEALPLGDVARNEAVARSEGIEIRCPLLDEEVGRLAMQVPVEEKFAGERKAVLRRVARGLGVPESACGRQKQALQYGSGVHKVLLKRFGQKRK